MPATTTFPRSQHWTIDGFRITVLVYKSQRRNHCAVCGQQGAIHCVWAERKADRFMGGPADFCDAHRPAKGTLPPLDYERVSSDRGDHVNVADPEWNTRDFTVTVERLVANPGWPCTICGQPSRTRYVSHCGHCTDPVYYYVSTTRHFTHTAEHTETSIGHDDHATAETYECDTCRTKASEGTALWRAAIEARLAA